MGDAIPSVVVFEREPGNKVNLAELFKGKKGVLFGVPGAFTPGCSKVRPALLLLSNWDLVYIFVLFMSPACSPGAACSTSM